jgi:hypothetical protein
VRRHPVYPELSESTSFCTVRNGLVTVPLLLSDPDGEATRSQVVAADAGDEAAPSTAMIARRSVSAATRRAAIGLYLRLREVSMRHRSAPMTSEQR